MTFTVEVLIKGKEDVVEREIDFEGPEAVAWTDEDARRVLELTLRTFDEVQNPDTQDRSVSLRGFSWIVTPVSEGVVIAIEIPSGAVVIPGTLPCSKGSQCQVQCAIIAKQVDFKTREKVGINQLLREL